MILFHITITQQLDRFTYTDICSFLRGASKLFFKELNNPTKAKQAARASAGRAPLSVTSCKKLIKLYKEFGMVDEQRKAIWRLKQLNHFFCSNCGIKQLSKTLKCCTCKLCDVQRKVTNAKVLREPVSGNPVSTSCRFYCSKKCQLEHWESHRFEGRHYVDIVFLQRIFRRRFAMKREKVRIEQERLARIEAERLEAERLARLETERLEAERLARIKAEQLEKERIAKMESEIAQREQKVMETEDVISSNMRWLRSCWSGAITSGLDVSVQPVNWVELRDQHAAAAVALQHTNVHNTTVDSEKWNEYKDSETDTDTDGDDNYDMSHGPNQSHPADRASNGVGTAECAVSATGSSTTTPIAVIEWCERARQWCKHASDQDCRRFQMKMTELSYFAARSLGGGVTETNLGRHKKMKGTKNVNLWRTKLDKSYV